MTINTYKNNTRSLNKMNKLYYKNMKGGLKQNEGSK